jgi:hypothetical protein
MIQHRCPNCEHILHSADGLGGTPIQCWKCHTRLVVPPKSEKGLEVPKDLLERAQARAAEERSQPGFFSCCWQSLKDMFPGRSKKKEAAPAPPSEMVS